VGVHPETAASRVLRGREAELARVMRLLDGLCAGMSGCLLIEGAAGAGKSALLRAFCAEATARGVAVAAVDADEVDALTSVGTLRPALKGCNLADRVFGAQRRGPCRNVTSNSG
jgi:predicted AAA+ superfamily ATPase